MSDHDAVVFDFSTNYVPDHQLPHKVFLYHRANMEGIKGDLLDFQDLKELYSQIMICLGLINRF